MIKEKEASNKSKNQKQEARKANSRERCKKNASCKTQVARLKMKQEASGEKKGRYKGRMQVARVKQDW